MHHPRGATRACSLRMLGATCSLDRWLVDFSSAGSGRLWRSGSNRSAMEWWCPISWKTSTKLFEFCACVRTTFLISMLPIAAWRMSERMSYHKVECYSNRWWTLNFSCRTSRIIWEDLSPMLDRWVACHRDRPWLGCSFGGWINWIPALFLTWGPNAELKMLLNF